MAEMHRTHAAPPAAHGSPGDSHAGIHHEESDANIVAVFGFGAGLMVVAAIVLLLMFVLFRYFEGREAARVPPAYPLAISSETRVPPEPRLQTDPREDLREMREKEDAVLGSYGWVDKNAGVVHIPIENAMRLMLERGVLTSRSQDASQPAAQVDVFPSDSSAGRVMERRRE